MRNRFKFDWDGFTKDSLEEIKFFRGRGDDLIFGSVRVSAHDRDFIVDVHHSWHNSEEHEFVLEIFEADSMGQPCRLVDSLKGLESVTSYHQFCEEAGDRIVASLIREFDAELPAASDHNVNIKFTGMAQMSQPLDHCISGALFSLPDGTDVEVFPGKMRIDFLSGQGYEMGWERCCFWDGSQRRYDFPKSFGAAFFCRFLHKKELPHDSWISVKGKPEIIMQGIH